MAYASVAQQPENFSIGGLLHFFAAQAGLFAAAGGIGAVAFRTVIGKKFRSGSDRVGLVCVRICFLAIGVGTPQRQRPDSSPQPQPKQIPAYTLPRSLN